MPACIYIYITYISILYLYIYRVVYELSAKTNFAHL